MSFTSFALLTTSFSHGLDGKEYACNAGGPGSIPGLGRSPGEGHGLPIPEFLPGEFHGQRSLVGYSLWDHKELDTTEQLRTHIVVPRAKHSLR